MLRYLICVFLHYRWRQRVGGRGYSNRSCDIDYLCRKCNRTWTTEYP